MAHACQSSSCGRTAGQCAATHIVMSLGPTCRRPKGFSFWKETSAVSPQNSQQLCLPKASDLLSRVAKAHKQATGVNQNKTKHRHILAFSTLRLFSPTTSHHRLGFLALPTQLRPHHPSIPSNRRSQPSPSPAGRRWGATGSHVTNLVARLREVLLPRGPHRRGTTPA